MTGGITQYSSVSCLVSKAEKNMPPTTTFHQKSLKDKPRLRRGCPPLRAYPFPAQRPQRTQRNKKVHERERERERTAMVLRAPTWP